MAIEKDIAVHPKTIIKTVGVITQHKQGDIDYPDKSKIRGRGRRVTRV